MVIYAPLPRLGDKVAIHDLDDASPASPLNGETGIVKNFFLDKGSRYEIQMRRTNTSKNGNKEIIRASNLLVEEDSDKVNDNDNDDSSGEDNNRSGVHILIPCHVDSEQIAVLFLRCIQSVADQQVNSEFRVFVGLSGPQKHRDSCLNIISAISSQQTNSRWYVEDTGEETRAEFEHLRHLVDLSTSVDAEAQLLLMNNVALMHPLRTIVFVEGKKNLGIPKECPFPLSCKLLLGGNITAEEGQMGRLITESKDFNFWQVDPSLKDKIEWVSNSRSKNMEADEYFDYLIPTSVMMKFFRLNPKGVTSSKFCGLRLLAILQKIAPVDAVDMPIYPWLLAQYKIGTKRKLEEILTASSDDNDNNDDAATSHSDSDKELAERHSLSPIQLVQCREHLESILIGYYQWNEEELLHAREKKLVVLN
eukprot:CAMPEP_0194127510 /NCGR_PEP_ID=MMETSP0150-20130528/60559_1 /TAXON_ID=122233 /ORGANISM="Chaetoceros debilis, Strain MM31A-1" /LENGTH=420 /DNA_ID=CAMNT_0038821435 /DNA_START=107 /DNA_END=1366 /DNA_ORIENTATION=-